MSTSSVHNQASAGPWLHSPHGHLILVNGQMVNVNGQMVNFARGFFRRVSVAEIYRLSHRENAAQFAHVPDFRIVLRDSDRNPPEAVFIVWGRILFGLEGHHSVSVPAAGEKVNSIIEEPRLIAKEGGKDDCIVMDHKRLLTGIDGHPTLDEAVIPKATNPAHVISIDRDSLVAHP